MEGQKQEQKKYSEPITGLLASSKSTNALFKPNSSGKLSIPVYSKTNKKEKKRGKKKTQLISCNLNPRGGWNQWEAKRFTQIYTRLQNPI